MNLVNECLVEGYRLQSILGRGSHGEVYRALQSSTGQVVALKVLRIRTSLHSPPRSVQIERFRSEIMACAALQHPNIVRAIDAGTTRGQLYSVFEYVPGPTLRAVLSEHRALPIARLREFMLQTLDALASAHARGIVHRDFKPENIVVSTTGVKPNFKVLDFGVSAFLEGCGLADSRLTGTGEALGTPAYAAPEQLRGEPPTARTDLYAWGLVALECMTGQPTVRGLSVAEVHYKQLLPDEISLRSELARHALGELLRWVLSKQPERRASDASAVYPRLERVSFDTLVDDVGYLSSESFSPGVTHPTPSEIFLHPPRLPLVTEHVRVIQTHAAIFRAFSLSLPLFHDHPSRERPRRCERRSIVQPGEQNVERRCGVRHEPNDVRETQANQSRTKGPFHVGENLMDRAHTIPSLEQGSGPCAAQVVREPHRERWWIATRRHAAR